MKIEEIYGFAGMFTHPDLKRFDGIDVDKLKCEYVYEDDGMYVSITADGVKLPSLAKANIEQLTTHYAPAILLITDKPKVFMGIVRKAIEIARDYNGVIIFNEGWGYSIDSYKAYREIKRRLDIEFDLNDSEFNSDNMRFADESELYLVGNGCKEYFVHFIDFRGQTYVNFKTPKIVTELTCEYFNDHIAELQKLLSGDDDDKDREA